LKQALKINLKQNHLYQSLLAELYRGIDSLKHIHHLDLALNLAKNENDKLFLKDKLDKARC